jgi:hypothetical protein
MSHTSNSVPLCLRRLAPNLSACTQTHRRACLRACVTLLLCALPSVAAAKVPPGQLGSPCPTDDSCGGFLYEFAFGGGDLTRQFARVFDDLGFAFQSSFGLRSAQLAATLDLTLVTLDSPVLTPLTSVSIGAGFRYYIPWIDPARTGYEVWVSNGIGYTFLSSCDHDDADCDRAGDTAITDYDGLYLSAGVGTAWILYRATDTHIYLSGELRYTTHYLESDTLDRHIMGGYWTATGGVGFTIAP